MAMTITQLEEALRASYERQRILRDLGHADRAMVQIRVDQDRTADNPLGAPLSIDPPAAVIETCRRQLRRNLRARLAEVEQRLDALGVDYRAVEPGQ